MSDQQEKINIYEKYFKRILDIFLSGVTIVLLSPLFLFLYVLIRAKLGHPVLFKQQRPGKDEKIFVMYKFRTMTNERDENGDLKADALRLTKFGKFLRATSLDELPELFNILKGDMSIVGPRPLLVQYLTLYNTNQKRRHEVRPGLTGYAQISGRNAISWEDKFKYDITYVENVSFVKDVIIILSTIRKVFIREGINSDSAATVEPFKGSND